MWIVCIGHNYIKLGTVELVLATTFIERPPL